MIRIDGPHFRDEQGRILILRGVNLGGSTKVPFRPNGATYLREGFHDHRNVSFVGRPFPLEEADEHFSRLRAWGLTFLRFLVTWEAIEHAGPGQYDSEYLDYLEQVVRRAGAHGFRLFIDPHQDVWSRMCGGDGAPGWTLEAVGMDVTCLSKTGAAIVHAIHGDPFPRMIWPTNYAKLAAATMFTLFFGGNDFAPRTLVEGEPVQEYLQRHYIEAIKQVARRLEGLPHVVGYDTLNEPSAGFIGCRDLNRVGGVLRMGASPTPFQAMQLGAGIPQQVGMWDMGLTGATLREWQVLNPEGIRAWRDGQVGVWQDNRVWDLAADGRPRLLRPNHFCDVAGREVRFADDYLKPFLVRYAREIRAVDSDAIIFLEGAPNGEQLPWGPKDPASTVYAGHWYDGLTLFTKAFRSWLAVDFDTGKLVWLPWRVRRSFIEQLARIKDVAAERMGGIPSFVGEVGIPFDMQGKQAFRSGDFSLQTRAMDATLNALDANLLSCTLWNYTADNDNAHGDQWNDEDLSIFSRDQQTHPDDIHSGGRALDAVVRPYARAVAGEPTRMSYDRRGRAFDFEFRHDPEVQVPTEVFVPRYAYPCGCRVEISDGTFELDQEEQTLTYWHTVERGGHRIALRPA